MSKEYFIFVSILIFVIIFSVNINAQDIDIYRDGNYSNGEYIDFLPLKKSIFVLGDITNLKSDLIHLENYIRAEVNMEIISEANIKSLFSNTFVIKEKGFLHLFFIKEIKEDKIRESESIFLKDLENKEKFLLDTKSNDLHIYFSSPYLKINKKNQIIFKLISSQINNARIDISENECIDILTLRPSVDFPIIEGYAKLEKEGFVSINWQGRGYLKPCPHIILVDGGTMTITNNSFMFRSKGKVVHGGMTFIPRENLIFRIEELDGVYGCLQKFSIKELVKELEKTKSRGIKKIEGKLFTSENGIKILDGNLEIDGIKIEGENIYFFESLNSFEDFDKNKVLKEKNSGIWFDSETASLIVTENFDKTVTVNGQKVKFENGKPTKTSLGLEEFYEIAEKREAKTLRVFDNLERASKIIEPVTCAEMGGEWKDEKEGCDVRSKEGNIEHIFVVPVIGNTFNKLSEAKPKIIDYQKGKICCLKTEIEPVQQIVYRKDGKEFITELSELMVGRNIFTAPQGTVVVDIAPQFLKQDIDRVKTEVFDPKSINKIPPTIKINDLLATLPSYLGAYYPQKTEIIITRKAIMEGQSTLTHEILHHFYREDDKKELFKERFRRYLDDSLDEKEDKIKKYS